MKKLFLNFGVYAATFFIGVTIVLFVHFTKTKETFVETPKVTETKANLVESPKEVVNLPEVIEENNDWETEEKFKIKLLETGEGFHGDEVQAKSGEIWLNLFSKDEKIYLKKTKLSVQKVFDVVIDDEKKKEKTGKTVMVADNPSIFLLKNANFLKEGEVKSYFGHSHFKDEDKEENIDYLSLKIGFVKDFFVGDEKYTVRVRKGVNGKKEKIIALILEHNKTSQTLHSVKYFDENDYLGTLYWVGDLDQDSKPDFYFNLYIHDNAEYKNLFLSSKAEKNKLVKKVAVFSTTGC